MITLGYLTLYGALLSALLTMVAGVGAVRTGNASLVRTSERAVVAMTGFVVAAVLVLQHALITLDFSFEYVSEYTSSTLPFLYRVGSMWAGQGGSLLLWALVVSLGAAWTLHRNRAAALEMSPYTWSVFAGIAAMFLTMTTFVASPFVRSPEGTADGNGLNPLLQDPLQIIHPLALYGGYVLYTIPFAVVIGQLIGGKVEGPWVTYARTWNILSWLMLTIGIVLGARWAYAELGWGGYWAWDPVENASLIPWLAGTAVLHTGLNYGGTRALRASSVAMLAGAFNLCLFGTYLTRSGVIQSVHAFGASSLGSYLGISVALIALASAAVIVWRMPEMRREDQFARGHGWMSKLLVTGLMLAMCAAVLWGTIFPLFARAFAGKEIAVTPGFFRVVVAPMGVLVLLQFALSPFIPGQETSAPKREIVLRSSIFGVVLIVMLATSRLHHPGVAFVIALAVLSLLTIVRKAIPKVTAGLRDETSPLLTAAKESSPYIAHIGLVVMLSAITLNVAYQTHAQQKLTLNSKATIGSQSVRLDGVQANQFPDRMSFSATVSLLNGKGSQSAVIVSKLEQFNNAEQLQAQVGIHVTPARDIYVVVDEVDATPGAEYAVLTVYDNPGVLWLWIGGFLLALGGILYGLSSMMRARQESAKVSKIVDTAQVSNDGLAALLSAAIAATQSGTTQSADQSVRTLIETARKITGEAASDADVVEFLKLAQSKSSTSTDKRTPAQLTIIGVSSAIVVAALAYLLGNIRGSSLPGIDTSAVVTSSSASATSTTAVVDKAKVGELMGKLAANPQDPTVLWDLGNTYFTGGDFSGALQFYQMLVKVSPNDDSAWIAVGASAFNLADDATAKKAWEKAATLNPKNAEAHYNLGFWYLAQNPAQEAKAKIEWQKVIDIDPKSEMATNVKQHLDSLATASPTATK